MGNCYSIDHIAEDHKYILHERSPWFSSLRQIFSLYEKGGPHIHLQ